MKSIKEINAAVYQVGGFDDLPCFADNRFQAAFYMNPRGCS
jgi:hypothetical protein